MFKLTLTFDNGPEPEVTPFVLDVLGRQGIRSTFFVLGSKLALPGRRALAERCAAEGHWIGNHTYSHGTSMGERSEADAAQMEIGRTEELIGDLAHAEKFFRPNGGGGKLGPHLLSPRARDYLIERNYSVVLWNSIPEDWKDADGWVARAMAQLRTQMAQAQPWSLMVLHDLPSGAMAHLESFIEQARALGAQFVQEFPPDCVPLRRGVAAPGLSSYVAAKDLRAAA
ncbi:MAG TPA: polysaccharide deacetylase family protein [Burkholderiales bacterium]|nr:polysaccharide deacetylase family protein [Burkholderiales bacterium]